MLIGVGPPLLFYLFSNRHLTGYEFLLGFKYVNDNREIVLYEEGAAQQVAKYMVYVHFLKSFVEALFVHRLAGRTVPVNTMMWQSLFYWVGLGGIVGFSLFHPEYKAAFFPGEDEDGNGDRWISDSRAMQVKVLIFLGA